MKNNLGEGTSVQWAVLKVRKYIRIGIIGFLLFLGIRLVMRYLEFEANGWSLFKNMKDIDIDNPYYSVGMECWERHDYAGAEENLLVALNEVSADEGKEAIETAEVSQKLGALYLEMNRYEECYDYLNDAYVTFREQLGDKDGHTIRAKCQISTYDISTGNIEQGMSDLQSTFYQVKYFRYKMTVCQMIAQCCMESYKYERALEWYGRLEDIYEAWNIMDMSRANLYNDYGVLFLNLGQGEAAVRNLEKAVSYWQILNISEDYNITNIYTNLAAAYAFCGQNAEAVAINERAILIEKNLYGENSAGIARMYENMATAYGNMQAYEKELEYLNMALDCALAAEGRNSGLVSEMYNSIGVHYMICGELQTAIDKFQEALEIRKNIIGLDHILTAVIYQNLAYCHYGIGMHEEGIDDAQEAISIMESLNGRDNPRTADSYTAAAWGYAGIGDMDRAKGYIDVVLDICMRHANAGFETVAYAHQTAGYIYKVIGCPEKAEEYLQNALGMYVEKGCNDRKLADTYVYLGDVNIQKEMYEEAFLNYRRVGKLYEQLEAQGVSESILSEERLRQLYDGLKPSAEYEQWLLKWK